MMNKDLDLLVNLRTHGKCVVGEHNEEHLERVTRILNKLNLKYATLNAVLPDDQEFLALIPKMKSPGILLVLNFHRLPDSVQNDFAQYMKMAADESDNGMKVIALGDFTTPATLVRHADDLCLRMHVIQD